MTKRSSGEEMLTGPFDVDSMSADDRMKLGAVIHARRTELGITAADLAERAQIDRKTLRTIETGERAGWSAKLKAILEALDIPQVGDYDKFSERTLSFILSAAPIFEQLPAQMKDEAQSDVVVLLAGKLNRSAEIPVIGDLLNVGGIEHDVEQDWVARTRDPDDGEDRDA